MKCLYCDSEIEKINLKYLLLEDDCLCPECREKLKIERKYIVLDRLKIETFYNYDGIFKNLLLQYKECYDEALAKVFLYPLRDYINLKYHGYKVVFVPSSEEKIKNRGFNHLELIFNNLRLEHIDGLKMKENLIQEGKKLIERKKMENNYIYEGKKVKKVLIVDDVLTSGSSIKGVYKAIKPYSQKIMAVVLARKETAFISKNKCV